MSKRSGLQIPPERLVFGKNPVMELVRHHPDRLEAVYIMSSGRREGELAEYADALRDASVRVETVSRAVLDKLLPSGGVHQGIAAKLRSVLKQSLSELIDVVQAARLPVLVALDEVTDPHNLGAVLRACECAGVSGVIIPEHRSAHSTPVVRKASAGASEHISLVEVTNLAHALREIKKRDFWIVGTALSKESQNLFSGALPTPAVVVFGGEGRGIRPVISGLCDVFVEIPMLGHIQSLNVSQAAAVVLFEYVRRQQA